MQQMPDLWTPDLELHCQQPHLCRVYPTPPHKGSPMCNHELQSRILLQPPTDPLCQLPTTTQSLRPKLPHLRQDHVGNAPRQRSNHGHYNGHLEGTEEGNGIALPPLPKFPPTVSLLYNISAKCVSSWLDRKDGCHETFLYSRTWSQFPWCDVLLLSVTGKMETPWGWYGGRSAYYL